MHLLRFRRSAGLPTEKKESTTDGTDDADWERKCTLPLCPADPSARAGPGTTTITRIGRITQGCQDPLDVVALERYGDSMATKRATVYFDEALHRALRIKAAETDHSVSDLVNDAVKQCLAEDAEDLAAFEDRASEIQLPFEEVVRELRASGKL